MIRSLVTTHDRTTVDSHVEWAWAAALGLTAFLIPLLLSEPQMLVGTAVNALLILAALRFSRWHLALPVILLPALGAVAGGILLGGTVALGLVLLVPAIWIGNGILVALYRNLPSPAAGRFAAAIVGAAALKAAWLFAAGGALTALGLLPVELLLVFAPLQFATALAGGLIAWPVSRVLARSDA